MRLRLQELNNQSLGEVLRRLRQDKKMSVTELSKKTGICRSYLTMIEQGKANPSLDLTMLMFKSLGKTVMFSLKKSASQEKP